MTVGNGNGAQTFSSVDAFFAAFENGTIGTTGTGSNLTDNEKDAVFDDIIGLLSAANETNQSQSTPSEQGETQQTQGNQNMQSVWDDIFKYLWDTPNAAVLLSLANGEKLIIRKNGIDVYVDKYIQVKNVSDLSLHGFSNSLNMDALGDFSVLPKKYEWQTTKLGPLSTQYNLYLGILTFANAGGNMHYQNQFGLSPYGHSYLNQQLMYSYYFNAGIKIQFGYVITTKLNRNMQLSGRAEVTGNAFTGIHGDSRTGHLSGNFTDLEAKFGLGVQNKYGEIGAGYIITNPDGYKYVFLKGIYLNLKF